MAASENPTQKLLLFGDVHSPYEHKRSWDLLLQVLHGFAPDHLICLGDLADCYAISSHTKDPSRRHDLQWEVTRVNELLDELDAGFAGTSKRFIEGNHEERLARYIAQRAPELFGLVTIPELLDLRGRGWKYTPYRKHDTIGKLHLTHDLGHAGRYSTYRTLDTIQHSVAFGHTHRLSYVVEGDVLGDRKVAASFGWLGDIDEAASYMHTIRARKDWTLGFGVGYLEPDTGYVTLVPIPILPKGKRGVTCTVEGVVYRA